MLSLINKTKIGSFHEPLGMINFYCDHSSGPILL